MTASITLATYPPQSSVTTCHTFFYVQRKYTKKKQKAEQVDRNTLADM